MWYMHTKCTTRSWKTQRDLGSNCVSGPDYCCGPLSEPGWGQGLPLPHWWRCGSVTKLLVAGNSWKPLLFIIVSLLKMSLPTFLSLINYFYCLDLKVLSLIKTVKWIALRHVTSSHPDMRAMRCSAGSLLIFLLLSRSIQTARDGQEDALTFKCLLFLYLLMGTRREGGREGVGFLLPELLYASLIYATCNLQSDSRES